MVKNMVTEFIITKPVENTKVNGLKTRNKGMELCNTQTKINTKDIG